MVSVLFSEPKISQFYTRDKFTELVARLFQCSSASRKFLNCSRDRRPRRAGCCFSALQRAENFSIQVRVDRVAQQRRVSVLFSEPKISQFILRIKAIAPTLSFSALQRAENFSITSVTSQHARPAGVSVLFSEPKISQFPAGGVDVPAAREFQCSSASRKFLNFAERRDVVT